MLTASRRGSEKVVDAKPLWVEAQRQFEQVAPLGGTLPSRYVSIRT